MKLREHIAELNAEIRKRDAAILKLSKSLAEAEKEFSMRLVLRLILVKHRIKKDLLSTPKLLDEIIADLEKK